MEPEKEKPDAAQSRDGEPDANSLTARKLGDADPDRVDREIDRTNKVQAKPVRTKFVEARMNERKFAHTSRRELLKLAPVLALGAFAIPPFQESLLKRGLAFSDWVSAGLFRRGHLAPTFADAQLKD